MLLSALVRLLTHTPHPLITHHTSHRYSKHQIKEYRDAHAARVEERCGSEGKGGGEGKCEFESEDEWEEGVGLEWRDSKCAEGVATSTGSTGEKEGEKER